MRLIPIAVSISFISGTRSGMIVMETTNGVLDESIYRQVDFSILLLTLVPRRLNCDVCFATFAARSPRRACSRGSACPSATAWVRTQITRLPGNATRFMSCDWYLLGCSDQRPGLGGLRQQIQQRHLRYCDLSASFIAVCAILSLTIGRSLARSCRQPVDDSGSEAVHPRQAHHR